LRSFTEFCRAALRALNESGVDYVIVGGVAAVYYGRPRTTVDVDLVIRFESGAVEKICAAWSKHDFDVSPGEMRDAVRESAHISIFDRDSPYRLDLRGSTTAIDEASLARKRRVEIYGEDAWIEAPEDLVIAKLAYGSPQDMGDVRAILIRQRGKLDTRYLKEQAQKTNVGEALAKIQEGEPNV